MELPLTYEIVYQVNCMTNTSGSLTSGYQTFTEALEVFEKVQSPATLTQVKIKTILTKEVE